MSILSDVATTLSKTVKTVVSDVSNLFDMSTTTIPALEFPLVNPLHTYASYAYIIGIGCLDDESYNNPDKTYMFYNDYPLVCKSANSDPYNRVNTPYGQFDFFIDDLHLVSQIGFENGFNTNVTNITFTITEPYSMGMFSIACQQVAQDQGHANWHDAPFLLTIDFRGNTENGQLVGIPKTSRKIPFKFISMDMTVNAQGSVYHCVVKPANQDALSDHKSKFTSDVSIKGKTVQEVLQTGEKSLQSVINQRFEQQKLECSIAIPDRVIILFPLEIASDDSTNENKTENTNSATTAELGRLSPEILKKIGVSDKLVQKTEECNGIGKSDLSFSESRKGDAPICDEDAVYDEKTASYIRSDMKINSKECDFRFNQDTDIPNAINQVILASGYVTEALSSDKLTPQGYKGWWRIDVQAYTLDPEENTATGVKPKLYVYRVVPYQVHASTFAAPNTKVPGLDKLKLEAVKEYNYIYTGKNADIINFEIKCNNSFQRMMSADNASLGQDKKQEQQLGGSAEPSTDIKLVSGNVAPSKTLGVTSNAVSYSATNTGSDKRGGGGVETSGTRAARLFMDIITQGVDMMMLNMEIIGDPYYIVHSGLSNYTSKASQYLNMNVDGTMNYQNGKVVISINFRTPIDINQATGMYTFKSASAPVMQYSGLYQLITVESNFRQGKFTQTLIGARIPQQENPADPVNPALVQTYTSSLDDITKAASDLLSPINKGITTFENAVGTGIAAVGDVANAVGNNITSTINKIL